MAKKTNKKATMEKITRNRKKTAEAAVCPFDEKKCYECDIIECPEEMA